MHGGVPGRAKPRLLHESLHPWGLREKGEGGEGNERRLGPVDTLWDINGRVVEKAVKMGDSKDAPFDHSHTSIR